MTDYPEEIGTVLELTKDMLKKKPKAASKVHNNLRLIEMAKKNNLECEMLLAELNQLFRMSRNIESFGFVIRYRDRQYSFDCAGPASKLHDLSSPLRMLDEQIKETW